MGQTKNSFNSRLHQITKDISMILQHTQNSDPEKKPDEEVLIPKPSETCSEAETQQES